ncbi:predicted protein [Plenodomus lingam JN3]|uniref:Predicted protein n=1 Tax=Leptosphaeria maculans (strain JN3 / isolate v23.1.3 / race Av1-4-5-6-7-8) TaxID=985895 RepID=E4ZXP0_LEPMJ|nr:predicted protein [Plenodomus lingam JN3]CBX96135.1 predicted protein [Plenodomus lingam JN3]
MQHILPRGRLLAHARSPTDTRRASAPARKFSLSYNSIEYTRPTVFFGLLIDPSRGCN